MQKLGGFILVAISLVGVYLFLSRPSVQKIDLKTIKATE
jgi:hypothetical protein